MDPKIIRLASHAGSWYKKQRQTLNLELENYLNAAQCLLSNVTKIKAIIGPHAGLAYSGPVAGWAYRYLRQLYEKQPPSRIFLLGPSHKKYFEGCSLSGVEELQTPLGNLKVDIETIKELKEKGKFTKLTKKEEENQHSLEMHMPYIYKVFGNKVSIIPIIVGVTDNKKAEEYGKIFAPYFDRQDSLFIISSDFCHWGPHFDYQPYEEGLQIYQFIEKLDKEGMKLIEKNDIGGFDSYIKQTQNTICGQFPIRVLMQTIKHSERKIRTEFVRYDQSEKVKSFEDSSVSYASSVSFVELE